MMPTRKLREQVLMPEFASGAQAASTITVLGDLWWPAGQGSERPAWTVKLALHSAGCAGDLQRPPETCVTR